MVESEYPLGVFICVSVVPRSTTSTGRSGSLLDSSSILETRESIASAAGREGGITRGTFIYLLCVRLHLFACQVSLTSSNINMIVSCSFYMTFSNFGGYTALGQ